MKDMIGARWVLVASLLIAACDEGAAEVDSVDAPASSSGKADTIAGSCMDDGEPLCGGVSDAGCGCDVECLDAGDCCSDFAAVCGLPIAAERGIELPSPISSDVFMTTLDDQIATLDAGLDAPQPAALLESLRQAATADQAALMIAGIASPPADRFTGERVTFADLEHYRPGFENTSVGTLVIEQGSGDASAEVVAEPEMPAILRFVSPISANVVIESLLDQRHALSAALALPETIAQTEALRQQSEARGEALMIASFGSPVPGSTCRARLCRDTFVELVAWAPGASTRPLGILWVRNFAETRDWVLFEPAAN